MTRPIRLTVERITLHERDVRLRMPFRFGVVTLTEAPQAFVRATVRLDDGRSAEGAAAELLAPKWFDKNPELTNEDNFDQLRKSLALARDAYLSAPTGTAFGLFAAHHAGHAARCEALGLNRLVAGFGPALVDRAILDALCRALNMSFAAAVRTNLVGIAPTDLCPDLAGFDFDAFLASLESARQIDARHTVGLLDPITASEQSSRVGDGLPETLEEVVAAYGHRWFKLKVGGDVIADLQRLSSIASVLDRIPEPYRASLDGNEQYGDVAGVLALWHRMRAEPRLSRLVSSVVFIEQPIRRQNALSQPIDALSSQVPVIIDESDDSLDAFVRARELGYQGISSKTCKGLYKSLLNRARCEMWNRGNGDRYFMSAEDLTIQAGLALQQDLALVALLGITHVERNGHHYVNGMADLSASEQSDFHAGHSDLYERSHGAVRLRITDGRIALASLDCVGYASAAMPDWSTTRPIDLSC